MSMKFDRTLLVNMLTKKAGYDVATPHGADRLQKDIASETGELLSVNTIRRLTGSLPYSGSQRVSTLDIVAQYLGFQDTKGLLTYLDDHTSDFGQAPSLINLADLLPGTMVELEWSPNRRIILNHIEGHQYLVEEAFNSKLQAGDIMEVGMVAEGMPFMTRNVIRGGVPMGPFTAAPESGLTKVSVFEPEQ